MGSAKIIVYKKILEKLFTQELDPGESINRRDLAEELMVSISPVNEAMAMLETEGIVQTIPRKGTFVSMLDWRDLMEILELRVAIESQAARIYSGEILREQKDQLLRIAKEVDDESKNYIDHVYSDIIFHYSLMELSGNRHLMNVFSSVITKSFLLVKRVMIDEGVADGNAPHVDLINELVDANPSSITDIFYKNLFAGKQYLLNNKNQQPLKGRIKSSSLDYVLSIMKGIKE